MNGLEVEKIIISVRKWVESVVIDLNLCPFAKRELIKNRIRFAVIDTKNESGLLMALQNELEMLLENSSIETTLLIHPHVLQNFYNFNQFLVSTERLICDLGLEGVFQIASFHPDYQFNETNADDAENYTNRSPYPMLHILRESSLDKAIANYTNVNEIPGCNVALMNRMGSEKLHALLKACF